MEKGIIVQLFARNFAAPPRISHMCKSLKKEGFKVFKVLYEKRGTQEESKDSNLIVVKGLLKSNGEPSNEIRIIDLIGFGINGAIALKKIDKKGRIKIMHCHRHSSLFPAFLSKLFGVRGKIILDYHDPWSGESTTLEKEEISPLHKFKIGLFHLFEKISLKFVDHIVLVSEPQKKLLKEKYNLEDNCFTIVTNSAAAEGENFRKKDKKHFGWENRKVVMFTGCIVPYFGLDLLVDSIPKVKKKIPEVLYVVKIAEEIKEKDYYEKLKEKVKQSGVEKNIRFIETWLSDEEYASFIASADLGIICHQPTLLTETADPDKLYEYLAAGLPIVATDLDIMKRYVKNGKNGFIVPHNSEEIARVIIRILSDEKLRMKMGVESLKNRYSWKDDMARLTRTYRRLIDNG